MSQLDETRPPTVDLEPAGRRAPISSGPTLPDTAWAAYHIIDAGGMITVPGPACANRRVWSWLDRMHMWSSRRTSLAAAALVRPLPVR